MLPQSIHGPWDWNVDMADLRATPVYSGTVTSATPTTVYTVPTGKRLILKNVTGQNQGSTSADLQLRVVGPNTIYVWSLTGYPTSGSRFTTNFWIVLDAGGQIQLARNNATTIAVVLSGSLHSI